MSGRSYTREEVEAILLSFMKDPEFDRVPKPHWFMEKYNCFPKKLDIVQATAAAFDNTKQGYVGPIETIVQTGEGCPPVKPLTLDDSTESSETKTPELISLPPSSPRGGCGE